MSQKVVDDIFMNNTEKIQDIITSVKKMPQEKHQIGQNLLIIRNLSALQNLVLVNLILSALINNGSTSASVERIQSLFTHENMENITGDLMLPISMDNATILLDNVFEELPEAQELKFMSSARRKRPFFRQPQRRLPPLNRKNVYSGSRLFKPSKNPSIEVKEGPTEMECTFFSNTVCLEILNYPYEAILRSIGSNKDMLEVLLTDYEVQDFNDLEAEMPVLPFGNSFKNNKILKKTDIPLSFRGKDVEEGFLCASQIKYARPKLAKSASGVWKYIINTGEHTQTLRLEKCSDPQASCSYISENYRSSCAQVYNYHRLLAWESSLGLHMDIFKVPICCSCHVHGYTDIFPPHEKDPPSSFKESFPGVDLATDNQNEFFSDFGESISSTNKHGPSTSFESILSIPNDRPSNFYSNDPSKASSYETPNNMKPSSETRFTRRPGHTLSGWSRYNKKPPSVRRPYDKLQQHAPSSRPPSYTRPAIKGSRLGKPSSSFVREADPHLKYLGSRRNGTNSIWYSQQFEQYADAMSLPNGTVDDAYQEQQKKVNYNYHPIIDFFSLDVSTVQPPTQSAEVQSNFDAWKPMILP